MQPIHYVIIFVVLIILFLAVTRANKKDFKLEINKLVDYLVVGHLHCNKTIQGNERGSYDTEVLMCPSFQGTDPFAFNKLGKSSKAACKMFIFDEKYGCTGTEKFILN